MGYIQYEFHHIPTGRDWRIKVSDDGEGVPAHEEFAKQLFLPESYSVTFNQPDGSLVILSKNLMSECKITVVGVTK